MRKRAPTAFEAVAAEEATAEALAAAAALSLALNETVECALWLDTKASRRVYRARCRLSRALDRANAFPPTGRQEG